MEVDECVAQAVDEAYTSLSTGRRITNIAGWLWKVANNKADDQWKRSLPMRPIADEHLEAEAEPQLSLAEHAAREVLANHRRDEAVHLARRLLPVVGHGQIRDVMDLMLEAVEAGEPDLPAELVAETLGLSSPGAARSLMSRGLDRLRKAAQAEGIEFSDELPANLPVLDYPLLEETKE